MSDCFLWSEVGREQSNFTGLRDSLGLPPIIFFAILLKLVNKIIILINYTQAKRGTNVSAASRHLQDLTPFRSNLEIIFFSSAYRSQISGICEVKPAYSDPLIWKKYFFRLAYAFPVWSEKIDYLVF